MKITYRLLFLLSFIYPCFAVTSYISHIQNYVNLVSAYYLDGYSTIDFPPLADVSQPMRVNIDIQLYAINGFDEVAGNIELVVAMDIKWVDEMSIIHSISFKIEDRSEFLVPYDMIWTPKLVLTNAIGETSDVGDSAYLCRFDMRTKQVFWKPRVVVSSSCTPDVTYYPFDKQTCEFIYTVWGFRSNEVLLTSSTNEWNQDEYGESGEWNIAGTSTETYILSDQSYIKFTLNIVRKPLYFAFNILLPVLVLCLLNSTVFLLPAESGERVGFSVTCFLSFMVLLNMIMDIMPRSSSPISFLCYYLVVMMSNSGGMTLVTILLMRVYHKPEKSNVPKWIQRCVTFVNCGCAKLKCCVLCCRAIRAHCCCNDKRKCGCAKSKKILNGDILVEVTVDGNDSIEYKVNEQTTDVDNTVRESKIKNKCCCFPSCRRPFHNKSISETRGGNGTDKSDVENILSCFGNKRSTGKVDEDTGVKSSDDKSAQERSLNVTSLTKDKIGTKHCTKIKQHGQEHDVSPGTYDSKCFSFFRRTRISSSDIVDIDNDILPIAKQGNETNKFQKSFKSTNERDTNDSLLNGWDSHQTGTTNKKRTTLEPEIVDKITEETNDNNDSEINNVNDEKETGIILKTHSVKESKTEKKQKQQKLKNSYLNKIDKNAQKQNVNSESEVNFVSGNTDVDVILNPPERDSTNEKKANQQVKFFKETNEENVVQEKNKIQQISQRRSSVSEKKTVKMSGKSQNYQRRGSTLPKYDQFDADDDDDEDSIFVDDSEVDSLADLEEEVGWPEVGRILDTFFFLVFSGGQAFFTVIFLVPLFTAPSTNE